MPTRLLPLCLLMVSALASAQTPAPTEPRTGDDTHAWLQLQISGQAAAGEARPMSGDVADAVYQRYLKSFGAAIPEQLGEGEASSSDGSSGAAAATGSSR